MDKEIQLIERRIGEFSKFVYKFSNNGETLLGFFEEEYFKKESTCHKKREIIGKLQRMKYELSKLLENLTSEVLIGSTVE